MTEKQLQHVINGCVKHHTRSQKLFYKQFYGVAMGICLRYTGSNDEAVKLMNLSFLKTFNRIMPYRRVRPVNAWFNRMMLNVVISHNGDSFNSLNTGSLETPSPTSTTNDNNNPLNYTRLLTMLRQLPGNYRTLFNLYVVDEYRHEEIDDMLGIAPGTSQLTLHKVRERLKAMLLETDYAAPENVSYQIDHPTFTALNVAEPNGAFYKLEPDEENKLDELFRATLNLPETTFDYNDADWANMEQLLGANKKPRRMLFTRKSVIGYAAAILLLIFGWQSYLTANVTEDKPITKSHIISEPQLSIFNNNQNDTVSATNGGITKIVKPVIQSTKLPVTGFSYHLKSWHKHFKRRRYIHSRNYIAITPAKKDSLIPESPLYNNAADNQLKTNDTVAQTQIIEKAVQQDSLHRPLVDTALKLIGKPDSIIDSIKKIRPPLLSGHKLPHKGLAAPVISTIRKGGSFKYDTIGSAITQLSSQNKAHWPTIFANAFFCSPSSAGYISNQLIAAYHLDLYTSLSIAINWEVIASPCTFCNLPIMNIYYKSISIS